MGANRNDSNGSAEIRTWKRSFSCATCTTNVQCTPPGHFHEGAVDRQDPASRTGRRRIRRRRRCRRRIIAVLFRLGQVRHRPHFRLGSNPVRALPMLRKSTAGTGGYGATSPRRLGTSTHMNLHTRAQRLVGVLRRTTTTRERSSPAPSLLVEGAYGSCVRVRHAMTVLEIVGELVPGALDCPKVQAPGRPSTEER